MSQDKQDDDDRPITLQEFSAAVSVWASRRERQNLDHDWREWITQLLAEDYRPLDGSLFGETILDYRARNRKAKRTWGV